MSQWKEWQNFKLWEYFKKYRNKLTYLKEQAKKLYYQNAICNNKQSTAQLWKTSNEILHHKNKKIQSNSVENVNQ